MPETDYRKLLDQIHQDLDKRNGPMTRSAPVTSLLACIGVGINICMMVFAYGKQTAVNEQTQSETRSNAIRIAKLETGRTAGADVYIAANEVWKNAMEKRATLNETWTQTLFTMRDQLNSMDAQMKAFNQQLQELRELHKPKP